MTQVALMRGCAHQGRGFGWQSEMPGGHLVMTCSANRQTSLQSPPMTTGFHALNVNDMAQPVPEPGSNRRGREDPVWGQQVDN